MLKMHGCLLLYLCTCITFIECVQNTGVCKRNSHNRIEYICCDNFEPKSDDKDKCQECPPGFTSLRGLPCIVCPENTYGSKCSFYCNCLRSEICDRVIGCVTKYQTQSGTHEMIYIYIMITGMIVVAIGICALCRKRATAILYRLKTKRKTITHSIYQLQVVDIENAQRNESSYDVIDEHNDKSESNLYDYEW